jgi:hypothetical protein
MSLAPALPAGRVEADVAATAAAHTTAEVTPLARNGEGQARSARERAPRPRIHDGLQTGSNPVQGPAANAS